MKSTYTGIVMGNEERIVKNPFVRMSIDRTSDIYDVRFSVEYMTDHRPMGVKRVSVPMSYDIPSLATYLTSSRKI